MSSSRAVVHSEGKQIIYDVYKFFEEEKHSGTTIPLDKAMERTAKARMFS